jgi:hypothetical protein
MELMDMPRLKYPFFTGGHVRKAGTIKRMFAPHGKE